MSRENILFIPTPTFFMSVSCNSSRRLGGNWSKGKIRMSESDGTARQEKLPIYEPGRSEIIKPRACLRVELGQLAREVRLSRNWDATRRRTLKRGLGVQKHSISPAYGPHYAFVYSEESVLAAEGYMNSSMEAPRHSK